MRRSVVVLLALGACSDPAAPPPDAAEVLPSTMPSTLSATGLYTNIVDKTLDPRLVEFAPNNVLWSDGAEKHRWIQLPPGATIDSTDMNHWVFPVGTKFFKEFAKDGKRLETRLIWRVADTGDRERDTLVGSFVWNDTETDAELVPNGYQNVRNTQHDAPSQTMCWRCHIGEPGRALGFEALQLGDVSMWPLSTPPTDSTPFAAPNPALGYLHANCGHCHNPNGSAWVDSHMVLRLDVDERDAVANQIYATTVGAPLEQWIDRGFDYRVVAGDPAASALYYRMSQRASNVQMPPIATELVDDAGTSVIADWINSL